MTTENKNQFANKFNGTVATLGMLYAYDPARGDVSPEDQVNTPPEKALVLPLAFTTINGKGMVVFEWLIEDPACPGVEMQVDYCVPECLYPASDYIRGIGERMVGKHDAARYNFARWVESQASKPAPEEDHLPRSAAGILMDCVELLGERGKQYDKTGQERSAARIAAVYNALKGASLTAMDIWDLLMILKLVRAQDATSPDSRIDLTSYAALSAEEMESIAYGSGASEVEPTGFKINADGFAIISDGFNQVRVKLKPWEDAALDRMAEDMKRQCGGGEPLNELN